MPVCTA